MYVAAQSGRGIGCDIGRGEAVEAEIDRFISGQHDRRVAFKGERDEEASWAESERRHTAARRARNRRAWIEHYEGEAAKLMKDEPKGAA